MFKLKRKKLDDKQAKHELTNLGYVQRTKNGRWRKKYNIKSPKKSSFLIGNGSFILKINKLINF